MKRNRTSLTAVLSKAAFSLFLILLSATARASAPMPVVNGNDLDWPAVDASGINVHRGDGSYVTSLPGNATSWTAPAPGDYYLVAADEGDWRDWPRSGTVTVEGSAASGPPMPVVESTFLRWPRVSALGINVHAGDGAYVTSLPGTATEWRSPGPGDYYLVATDAGDWPGWLRSETVTVIDFSEVFRPVTGLRVDIYSRTAAEVFWDRKPGAGNRYLVFVDGAQRDDEEVADTNGTSWFSDEFTPGSTTLITVVAIDANGFRSDPRSVIVTPPGGQPAVVSPTINRDNHEDVLADVFSAYFGGSYRTPLLELTNNLLDGVIGAAAPFDAPYTCVNGGEAVFEGPFSMQFDECRIGGAVYSGAFFIGDRNTSFGSGSGLTITTDTGEEIRFRGFVRGPTSSLGFYMPVDLDVSVQTITGEWQLENADHEYSFGHLLRCCGGGRTFSSAFEGGFRLRSPGTGGRFVEASTLVGFFYSRAFERHLPDWNHRAGVLSVSAADGSRLILDAGTGDDDTVSIRLINGTETEDFTRAWSPRWSSSSRQVALDAADGS